MACIDMENKENMGSGRLFSPSKYAAHVSKSTDTMGGFFGRILEARNEAKTCHDEELAKQLMRKEHAAEEARKKQEAEEEKASAMLAEKLHVEAQDEEYAQQLSVKELEEMQKWKQQVAEIEEGDRKLVEQLLEEEERAKREIEAREHKDSEEAEKLLKAEIKELEDFVNNVTKKWKKPVINCSNVEEGMLIAVTLPHVKSLDVSIDPKLKLINVTATPDFSGLETFTNSLPKKLRPQGIDITLDLKIVGKENVSTDDVKTRYEEGIAYIYVHNACIKTKKGKVAARIRSFKSGLKRMFSGRRSSTSSKK